MTGRENMVVRAAGGGQMEGGGVSVSLGGRYDYRCTHNVLEHRPRAE